MLFAVTGFAQNGPSLTGSYAFLANAKQYDSYGETGGAIVGLLNFDGAGNVSGTAVLKARTGVPQDALTGSSAVQGTYTTNPDGSGNLGLEFTDFGFSVKLAMVIADGGKSIQFADGTGSTGPVAFNANLQGTPDRVIGNVPGVFFLQNSRPGAQGTGMIPLTLIRTYNEGVAVYSLAAPATGTGPVTCPDGTSDTWSATIPSVTVVMRNLSGNFLMPVVVSGCKAGDVSYSGLANLNPSPNGITLVLHLTGFYITGTARATTGGAPKGLYGVQFIGEPFPNAGVEVINFDGSGGITASMITPLATNALTGTYTAADGSGTITVTQNANPSLAPVTFAYVLADGASTIYLLRTSGGGSGVDNITGVGHLQ